MLNKALILFAVSAKIQAYFDLLKLLRFSLLPSITPLYITSLFNII